MSDEPPVRLLTDDERERKVRRLPGTEGRPRIWQPVLDGDLDIPIASDVDGRCRHRQIRVESDRRVFCLDCNRYVDAVAYILQLASDWAWHRRTNQEARAKNRALHEELAELERKIRNAKSRLKRARPPEVEAARKAVEQARRAIWRTTEALRSLGIDDSQVIHGKLREASASLGAADLALSGESE